MDRASRQRRLTAATNKGHAIACARREEHKPVDARRLATAHVRATAVSGTIAMMSDVAKAKEVLKLMLDLEFDGAPATVGSEMRQSCAGRKPDTPARWSDLP